MYTLLSNDRFLARVVKTDNGEFAADDVVNTPREALGFRRYEDAVCLRKRMENPFIWTVIHTEEETVNA